MFRLFKKAWNWIVYNVSRAYLNIKHKIQTFSREKVLTKKILFTIGILSIFVIAGTITMPGVGLNKNATIDANSFLGIINIVGGGGLSNFSIVALGIGPFITSSLIMMVAQTKLFPPIHRLSQSGPLGRRKINIITRFLTIAVAIVQSIVLIRTLFDSNQITSSFVYLQNNSNYYKYFILPSILIGGSLFSLFLGEQITDKGVGNGTSLLIFSGIIVQLPAKFRSAYSYYMGGAESGALISNIIFFGVYIIGFLVLIFIISYVYLAERKIPIQQTGAGMSKNIKDISVLPIKVNPAGVMPIIFSLIVLSLPTLIVGLLDPYTSSTRYWVERSLRLTDPIGFSIFIVITFLFSIGMGLQQSRVDKIAEDFGKNSTFIPGIRPGEQTEDYLISVVLRLSIFSAFYLVAIGATEPIMQMLGMPRTITYGGTSLIILVSTALETMSQIKARRESEKISHKRKKITKSINKNNNKNFNNNGDLLW
ncbi:preprotein translocase subunit SecY [Mesomycoplasma lagogenitalium]|uniref:Protein translocase subunit SecY n=1 Tax=Mesomycoplasma lagogenitalium TaxID=171286 RepID=A0ABY8LTK9_9BACT|nr:preprotein translocase subunit SecY [Mesomycoplasma lagogenitalium]WGI36569.1 preprotein translocase subunit SecY [Mesomycoplasma lagogenitalium]